jgi:hypothetical protein
MVAFTNERQIRVEHETKKERRRLARQYKKIQGGTAEDGKSAARFTAGEVGLGVTTV